MESSTERNNYTPFGSEWTSDVLDTDQKLRFTGHERDLMDPTHTTDDVDYMHARHYNLNLARFLSVDPVGGDPLRPQSWNGYAYVLNNPLRFTDPFGLSEADEMRNSCADGADGGLVCEGEIEVTAPYYVEGFDLGLDNFYRERSSFDLFADLSRQPRVESMSDVLNDIAAPHQPCVDSFGKRFARSYSQTNAWPDLFLTHQGIQTPFRLFAGGQVAKARGTESGFSIVKQTIGAARGKGALPGRLAVRGAMSSGALGSIAVSGTYFGGTLVGTALNVQVVEVWTNPCVRQSVGR